MTEKKIIAFDGKCKLDQSRRGMKFSFHSLFLFPLKNWRIVAKVSLHRWAKMFTIFKLTQTITLSSSSSSSSSSLKSVKWWTRFLASSSVQPFASFILEINFEQQLFLSHSSWSKSRSKNRKIRSFCTFCVGSIVVSKTSIVLPPGQLKSCS